MTEARYREILVAYARYMFGIEGIPRLNDAEFQRKLAHTIKQKQFQRIGLTPQEAFEAIERLSKETLEDR